MNPWKSVSGWIITKSTEKKGVTLVEYSLLLLLVAFVVFLLVEGLGEKTKDKYSTFNSQFSNAASK